MKDRIKLLRQQANLTQAQFAERIGLSRNYVAMLEIGRREASDRTVSDICRAFSVNEGWLRTGSGDMCVKKLDEQEMLEFFNEVASDLDDSFRRRFIHALAKIPSEEWGHIEDFIASLQQKEQDEKDPQ